MDLLIVFVSIGGGGIFGALLAFVLMKRRAELDILALQQQASATKLVLEERLDARVQEITSLNVRLREAELERREISQSLSAATVSNAELETRLNEERKQANEKLVLLQESREQLRLEFQNLANRIFEEKSRRFTDQSRANLDQLLTPFREQLKDFGKKVDDTYQKEARERFSLRQEVIRLQDLNQQIQTDAVNLTNALKGQSKTQGNWGEVILERVLEQSGLHKGREYEAQGSYRDMQGRQLRPDIIVHLPENKDIIIDSKVSLTAYEKYVNATDDDVKSQAIRQHLVSLHSHIKELQGKQYETLPEITSLDFVLMFIPVEGAFMLALDEDENLFRKCFEHNIMIVSPSTLLVTLRTIQNIWRYEYQNRNAMEIARQAGNLYDHFVRFVAELEKVGDHLEKARQSYDQAHKRLSTGRGNLVRRAEGLRELGIQNTKALSVSMQENAHIDLNCETMAPQGDSVSGDI
jgi:DNA recombination protein RmuC